MNNNLKPIRMHEVSLHSDWPKRYYLTISTLHSCRTSDVFCLCFFEPIQMKISYFESDIHFMGLYYIAKQLFSSVSVPRVTSLLGGIIIFHYPAPVRGIINNYPPKWR